MGEKKKSSKKDITKKYTKVEDHIYLKKIFPLIMFAICLFSLLSLTNLSLGFVGKWLNKLILSLFGAGAIVVLIVSLVYSVIYIFRSKASFFCKKMLLIGIVVCCLLILFDSSNPINYDFMEKLKSSIRLGQEYIGGGLIGAMFGYAFYNLLGKIGTYLMIFFLVLISLLILSETTLSDLFEMIKTRWLKMSLKKKEKNVRKVSVSHERLNITPPRAEESDDRSERSVKRMSLPIFSDYPREKTESPLEECSEEKSKELILDNENTCEGILEENLSNQETRNEVEGYLFPSIELLALPTMTKDKDVDHEKQSLLEDGQKIVDTLMSFKIETKLTDINVGPTITCYELEPPQGIKLSKIVSLSDNIALALAASDIRIEAPIPGKSVVGVEVPNRNKVPVLLREIISSSEFHQLKSDLPLPLGKDVQGNIMISQLDKMPHLLIAGATGAGKSVCINTILVSILYKATPDRVKLILIDPKVVELNVYNGIPHLMVPVVTDAKKASMALNWAVHEMEGRYRLFAEKNVRDITAYNNVVEEESDQLPMLLIVIDELSDLMMVAAKEVESSICRLAQMARAAGIYLIIATQRPSVDVITGIIKANIPSRISFAVSSQIDSRTILDSAGAEKLLGKGDMLFYPSFYSKPQRIQGAFVSDKEVENVIHSLKQTATSEYSEEVVQEIEFASNEEQNDGIEMDPLLREAIEIAIREKQVSISYIQRRLKIGYNRSANIVEEMERLGVVGKSEGSKPRKILVDETYLERI